MFSAVTATSGGEDSLEQHNANELPCRLVKEYEDPSLVPEYWVCSMNTVRGGCLTYFDHNKLLAG